LNQFSNHFINTVVLILYLFLVIRVTEVLFVIKDDKCYGLTDGVLVLGHNRQVREPKIIEELCYKQIISFTNDFYHVMAL
jgi:hypothetical protein